MNILHLQEVTPPRGIVPPGGLKSGVEEEKQVFLFVPIWLPSGGHCSPAEGTAPQPRARPSESHTSLLCLDLYNQYPFQFAHMYFLFSLFFGHLYAFI